MQETGFRHSDEGRIQVSGNTEHGSFVPQDDGKHPTLTPSDLLEMIDYIAKSIRVDTHIYSYVSDIISATRRLTTVSVLSPTSSSLPPLSYGASTRAGLALIRAGRIRALLAGRDYMMPEDVKYLAHDILDHRI